jgi:hypothetical protein
LNEDITGTVNSYSVNPGVFQFASRVGLCRALELCDCALSDRSGVASIAIPWGSECHYDATLESRRANPNCRQVEVPVCTLDFFVCGSRRRDFFHQAPCELSRVALPSGALQMIRRSKPAILIEILPNPDKAGSPAAEVFEVFRENGYEPYWFDGERLRRRKPGERSQNYFFLTRERFDQLPANLQASASDLPRFDN